MWPGERMDMAVLVCDVEGARGPCGLEKELTGLSLNEMCREPEDRVAWRKHVTGFPKRIQYSMGFRKYNHLLQQCAE